MNNFWFFIFLFGLNSSILGMTSKSVLENAEISSPVMSYDTWLSCLAMPVPCKKVSIKPKIPNYSDEICNYAEEICNALKKAYPYNFVDAEFYKFFSPLITSWLFENRYHDDLMSWFEYEVANGVCMFIQQTESLREYCRNNCDKEVARYRKILWANFGRNVLDWHVSMSSTVYAQHVVSLNKEIDAYKQSLYAIDPLEKFKQNIIKKINDLGLAIYQEIVDEATR